MSSHAGRDITLALIADWTTTLSLVFGGCCSNALTLEQLVSQYPHAGSLITFAQFLFITLRGIPKFVQFTPYPHLRPRQIPILPYLIQVLLFYFISLLNNAAFAYKIPMTVHIIFRSGGLVISMIMGWLLLGRRYSWTQIVSVIFVTMGVVLTTLSASKPESPKSGDFTQSSIYHTYTYATGILILFLALVLSGLLGIIQDRTYALYGKHSAPDPNPANGSARIKTKQDDTWQEAMFYLHFLAMPMFYSVRRNLLDQFRALNDGLIVHISLPLTMQFNSVTIGYSSIAIPTSYLLLLVNTLTQLVCVAGVHRLISRVSTLTVTLVLVVRKAVSLIISINLFGSGLEGNRAVMMWAGATLVFVGTLAYSLGGSSGKEGPRKKED